MLTFDELRRVNSARCEAADGFAHPLGLWSILEWLGALCGEAGEAANIAKKIRRGDFKENESDGVRALMNELADMIIYADLCAARLGQDLDAAIIAKFNSKSEEKNVPYRLSAGIVTSIRRVYIAGPIGTGPERHDRCLAAIHQANAVLEMGLTPFVPHLCHYWDTMHPQEYQTWMEYGKAWLMFCHVILRLPGESPGSDKEVAFAEGLGIPVVYSLDELKGLVRERNS